MTLAMVTLFGSRSMEGVDIDGDLVGKGIQRLCRLRKALRLYPKSTNLTAVRRVENPAEALESLRRVRFRRANWLEHPFESLNKYDVITCFSITKWIHLNWGDSGIKSFFRKCERSLRPGGQLVIEPQPWKSYVSIWKKRDAAIPAVGSLQNLKLRPNMFVDWITNNTKLRLMKSVELPMVGNFKQRRQIFTFRKLARDKQIHLLSSLRTQLEAEGFVSPRRSAGMQRESQRFDERVNKVAGRSNSNDDLRSSASPYRLLHERSIDRHYLSYSSRSANPVGSSR